MKRKAISSLAYHRLPMFLSKRAILSFCIMLLINIFRSTSSDILTKMFFLGTFRSTVCCCCPVPQLCLTFATPWTAAHQASLSSTICRNLLEFMSIESVMPSNHLVLCHPLLLLPSIFPSIRVFSNESALRIRWPNFWSFGFSINPSNEVQLYNFP